MKYIAQSVPLKPSPQRERKKVRGKRSRGREGGKWLI